MALLKLLTRSSSWTYLLLLLWSVTRAEQSTQGGTNQDALQEIKEFILLKFNEMDSKISNLDSKLTEVKNDLVITKGTVESIDSEVPTMGERTSESLTSMTNILQDLAVIKVKVDTYDSKISTIDSNLRNIDTKLTEVKNDLIITKGTVESIDSEVPTMLRNISTTLEEVKNDLVITKGTVVSIDSEVSTIEEMISLKYNLSGEIHTTTSVPAVACPGLFTAVGNGCFLLALGATRLTWSAARQYCQGLGADLAVIEDANQFADIMDYIGTTNADNAPINAWVGGSDMGTEDSWIWEPTGKIMQRGPPFWGSRNNYIHEPSGGRSENCAGLYYKDKYYMHDFQCGLSSTYGTTFAPLCQKI